MKAGDYLYCKKSVKKSIRCGDGIVGEFNPKIGDMCQIIGMTETQLSIKFGGHEVWFLLNDSEDYFCDWYKKYFDELRIERKNKLEQISKLCK